MKIEKDPKSLGYKLGSIFAVIAFSCITAILIAITIRIIGWVL